jgi:hypothetical protein
MCVSNVDSPAACHMGREEQVIIYGDPHEDDAFNAFDESYQIWQAKAIADRDWSKLVHLLGD